MRIVGAVIVLVASAHVAVAGEQFLLTSTGDHAFPASAVRSLHQTSATLPDSIHSLPNGGCLTTLYLEFKALFGWSDDEYRAFRRKVFLRSNEHPSINHALRELHAQRLASKVMRIQYVTSEGRYAASIEDLILKLAKQEGGVHFFGLAVNGGRHSVLLAVGKSKRTNQWEVYWFDQQSQGFSPQGNQRTNGVTGRLDELVVESRFRSPNYGWSHVEIGHLKPKR